MLLHCWHPKGHNGSSSKGADKENGKKNTEVNAILKLSGFSFLYCKIPTEVPRQNLGELVRKLGILLEQARWKNSARYGLQLLM